MDAASAVMMAGCGVMDQGFVKSPVALPDCAGASSIDRRGTGNTKDEILYVMYCNISHIITFLALHVAMSIA